MFRIMRLKFNFFSATLGSCNVGQFLTLSDRKFVQLVRTDDSLSVLKFMINSRQIRCETAGSRWSIRESLLTY